MVSFPPWGLWPLMWFALVPWFFVLHRASHLKHAVVQGVWLSVFMSLGSFFWVAFVLHEFGNLPWVVSFLGLVLFSFVGQPQFFLFALVQRMRLFPLGPHKSQNFSAVRLIILSTVAALLYTGLDWLSPKIFMDTLGHALYRAQCLRQVAEWGGAWVLTFLIYFVNEAIYGFVREWALQKGQFPWKTVRRWLPQVGMAIVFSLSFWIYGLVRQEQIQRLMRFAPQRVQVAAVQANIGDFEKVAAEKGVSGAAEQVLGAYGDLSRAALQLNPRPQVIVWPETSYPTTFGKPHSRTELLLEKQVMDLVKTLQIPLLFGGYDTVGGKDFNAFFFLTPDQKLQAYHKSVLLIFGEFIPGAESFEWIRNAFPQVGNFGRGRGPEVVDVPYLDALQQSQVLRFGPIICYEALFSNFVIESARRGSQAIFNITNDGWFGVWGEPQLHLALSTFRSVETRLPFFRSTNTGISALILPDGTIQDTSEIGEQAILNVSIPLTPPIPTLLKLWGDWFGGFALILGGLGVCGLHLSSTSFKRRTSWTSAEQS